MTKKKSDQTENEQNHNVIDMTERIREPEAQKRVKNIKLRLDLENAKVAISASIVSIVVVVTMANHHLAMREAATSMTVASNPSSSLQMQAGSGGRSIASVSTGTSEAEDSVVARLARKDLSNEAAVGRRPSSIDQLSFGYLEGKYAINLEKGKLTELQFASSGTGDHPKHIEDLNAFIESHRELLPFAYSRTAKVDHVAKDGEIYETFELMNEISKPVGHVQFKLDGVGRLLSMKVMALQVAAE